mmetsp:Transcript_45736/g.110843  ORF Transcript_45736/g.110843 Transcript_45736/m.110843 type:complete len:128 (-) Transcript_45736:591-974(-)
MCWALEYHWNAIVAGQLMSLFASNTYDNWEASIPSNGRWTIEVAFDSCSYAWLSGGQHLYCTALRKLTDKIIFGTVVKAELRSEVQWVDLASKSLIQWFPLCWNHHVCRFNCEGSMCQYWVSLFQDV